MLTKKKILIFLLTVALALFTATFMVACNQDTTPAPDTETTESNNNNETNSGSDKAENALNVSYDENLVCYSDSIYELSDALTVEIVTGNTSRRVQFVIRSAEISDDGNYIDVVISAENLEKSIRLPYVVRNEPQIRAELKPLYDFVNTAGDKFFSLDFTSETQANGEKNAFGLNLTVNAAENDIPQFALTCKNNEDSKVIAVFKDGAVSIGGKTLTLEEIFSAVADLVDFAGMGDDQQYADLSDMGDDQQYPEFGTDDEVMEVEDPVTLESVFEKLSTALDEVEKFFNSPYIKKLNLSFTAENGVYNFNIDSKTLLKLITTLQLWSDNNDSQFDIVKVINVIDEKLGGAISAGNYSASITLTINENGLSFGVSLNDATTQSSISFAAAFNVSEEAYALPDASDNLFPEFDLENITEEDIPQIIEEYVQDVEICVPVSIPQKEIELSVIATLHLSSLFNEDNKDYVTAEVYYNNEEIFEFVLSDEYVYLDASGFAKKFSQDSDVPDYVAFYQAFELNGEPATLKDLLVQYVTELFSQNFVPGDEPHYPSDDYPTYEDEEPDFPNGYSYNNEILIPIGATEEELRERLEFVVYNENDEPINYDLYTLKGFDSSASSEQTVYIVLSESYETEIKVIVYNPETTKANSVYADKTYVKLNTSVGEVQEDFGATVTYTDGTVRWEEYTCEGVTIETINGEEVTDESVFDKAGDLVITISFEEINGFAVVHVYDPENLVPAEIHCEYASLCIDDTYTEETLRELIGEIAVIYDDGITEEYTDEYEIEYSEDEQFLTIRYGELTEYVELIYNEEPYPNEEPQPFSIFDVISSLRFIDFTSEDMSDIVANSLSNLIDIFNDNAELFDSVCVAEQTDDGLSVSIDCDKLLEVINLFVGIPTEEGLADIDYNTIAGIINSLSYKQFGSEEFANNTFINIFGISLNEALKGLYVDIFVTEEGFTVSFSNGADRAEFFSIGRYVYTVESSEPYEITDEMIKNAQGFENLPNLLMPVLFGIVA